MSTSSTQKESLAPGEVAVFTAALPLSMLVFWVAFAGGFGEFAFASTPAGTLTFTGLLAACCADDGVALETSASPTMPNPTIKECVFIVSLPPSRGLPGAAGVIRGRRPPRAGWF